MHVARRIVRAPLALRTLRAERLQFGRAVAMPGCRVVQHGGLDGAMHQQIRIAADRRGEMRVLLAAPARNARCWSAGTPPAPASGSPGPRAAVRRAAPTRRSTSWRNSRGVGLRRETSRPPAAHSAPSAVRSTRFSSGWPWTRIQASRLGETQRHGRLDVGGDHALLDHAVRIVARSPHKSPRSCRRSPMRALTSPPRKSSAPRASRAAFRAP